MQVADQKGGTGSTETLRQRTGVEGARRSEDTAGGATAPKATRRDVLKWGLLGTLLAILAGGAGGFLQYFYPKKVGSVGGKILVPGSVADYPVGTVYRV